MMSKLPLEGLRVTDVTINWAGPYLTNLLATLGAQVIKVESIQVPDNWRGAGTYYFGGKERFWEWSPFWNQANTNKLGITLNLTKPEGADIFKRLVKISDIVAENYTPRVMKNFGLHYDVLKEINTRLIMISLPANGTTGPWKDHAGFGHSIEAMAGLPQLTGDPGGLPKMSGWGLSDPIGGANGVAAVLMALLYRQTSGKGQYIDLSQTESLTCMIGEALAEASMNKRSPSRRGNRHPHMAPHGYYQCKGEDLWVGIAVSSEEEWEAFCTAIGNPPWTKEERFADMPGRLKHQDALDQLVEAWTLKHDHYEVMNLLQKVGVAAGAVITSAELLDDPHLKTRGVFKKVERDLVGTHPYYLPSAAQRFSKADISIRRPAPFLGQHNEVVLGELLGMSKAEIQRLAEDRIIGTKPLGAS